MIVETAMTEEHNTTKRPISPYMETVLGKVFPVLDHGMLRVVDYMGNDESIVQAARVSYGKGTKQVSTDRALIRSLMRRGHWSPFEMCELKLHVKLPIFAARQWIRHKGNVNECSARYSEMSVDSYIPELERILKQSVTDKQGSGDSFTEEESKAIKANLSEVITFTDKIYNFLLEKDLTRELARFVKTTSSYTEWYWKTNLRDLLHFCRQRCDSHAQYEIRVYADILRDDVLRGWVPTVYGAYIDYIENAYTLSGPAKDYLFSVIDDKEQLLTKPDKLSKTEWNEFKSWYNANLA